MALDSNRKTITFDEVYSAWTSFHSYVPEWMERLGTNFYTFKDGELYLHDDSDTRTNFYGVTYGCDITYSSNQSPSETKVFKTISLETNSDNWFATIDSELESGEIGSENSYKFQDKEGFRYAYIRRLSTDTLDFNKLSIIGLGTLLSIPSANQYKFRSTIPNQVSFNGVDGQGGDKLYFIDTSGAEDAYSLVGVVSTFTDETITVPNSLAVPSVDDFCFIAKNPQTESFGVRGYHAKIKLTNKTTSFAELFAASAEVFKSHM